MRLCAVLGLLGALVMAILIGCSQSESPPRDSAGMQDTTHVDPDAGDARVIQDCTIPCVQEEFLGGC